MWLHFLKHPSIFARPFLDFSKDLEAHDIFFFTDASKKFKNGCGGVCKFHVQEQGEWFYLPWEENFLLMADPSIAYLELYALTVAVLLWLHRFQNRRIFIFCDNMSVVHMINNTTSSCKNCMVLIRMIVLHSMIHNTRVFAKYINTKSNVLADNLSRMRIDYFRKLTAEQFKRNPEPVPERLWPMEKLWSGQLKSGRKPRKGGPQSANHTVRRKQRSVVHS